MADGGSGFIEFTPSQQAPFTPPTIGKASSSGSTKTESGLIDDEMYKMLINKGGLKNDVDAFQQTLSSLDNSVMDFIGSGNDRKARQMFAEINTLRINKEMWESALKQSQDQGGLSEVAIGTQGEMYVKDKDGQIGAISVEKYKQNSDNYNPLTVSELLIARQYDKNLTNNKSVFTVANNAIGLDKIMDQIRTIVSSIGKETISSESVINKNNIPNGVKEQMETLGTFIGNPSSDVKLKLETMSERGHLNQALGYIWTSLGKNAQLKLSAVAAMNGVKPETLISNALISGTDESKTSPIDILKTVNGETPEKIAASSTVGTENINPWEAFNLGEFSPPGSTFLWNDPKADLKIKLSSTSIAPLMTRTGKPFGNVTLNNILNSDYGTLLKSDLAYFGNKKIPTSDRDKLISDASNAARVYIPVYEDGTPNYELLKVVSKVESEIKKHPDWNPNQINSYYQSQNLDFVKVDTKKQITTTDKVKPFLVFYAYGADGAESVRGNSEIEQLEGSNKTDASTTMKSVWTAQKKTLGKDDLTTGLFYTDYYKGMVAIPYNESASLYASSMVGHGPTFKTNTLEESKIKQLGRNIVPVDIN